MKLKYLISYIVFTQLILISCKTKESTESGPPQFPKEYLAEISILGDDLLLPVITDMAVNDTTITALGLLDDYWIHQYDKNSGKYIGRYIRRGQGPEDIVGCESFYNTGNSWKIYDYMARQVKVFSNDFSFSSLSEKDSIPSKEYMGAHFAGLSFKNGGKKLFSMIKSKDADIKTGLMLADDNGIGTINFETPVDEDNDKLKYFRWYNIELAPNGKKMVATSNPGCYMSIYDVDGNEMVLKRSKCFFPLHVSDPENSAKVFNENKTAFTALAVTDSRIITCMADNPEEEDSTDIMVWDWDGKPLRRYKTDKIILTMELPPNEKDIIYAFAIDKKRNSYLVKIRCQELLK